MIIQCKTIGGSCTTLGTGEWIHSQQDTFHLNFLALKISGIQRIM